MSTVGETTGSRRRLVVGSAWSALSTAVGLLVGPGLTVILVRRMTHIQYGELAISSDIVGLLAVVAGLGMNMSTTQVFSIIESNSGREALLGAIRRSVRLLPWLSIPAGLGAALVLILFRLDGPLRPSTPALLALLPLLLASPTAFFCQGVYQTLHWPRQLTLRSLIRAVLTGSTIIVVLLTVSSPTSAMIALARGLGAVFGAALLVAPLAKLRHSSSTTIRPPVQRIATLGFSFMIGGAFGTVLMGFDVFTLGMFRGARVAGVYAPAAALIGLGLLLPSVLQPFYIAGASKFAAAGNVDGLAGYFHWTTRWTVALASPVLAAFILTPSEVLRFIFGLSFTSMSSPLRIMTIGLLVNAVTGFNDITFDVFGYARVMAARSAAFVIVFVVACLVLVPRYGVEGAAAATAIGFVIPNIVGTVLLLAAKKIAPADRRLGLVILSFAGSLAIGSLELRVVGGGLAMSVLVAVTAAGMTAGAAGLVGGRQERLQIVHALRDLLHRHPACPGGHV